MDNESDHWILLSMIFGAPALAAKFVYVSNADDGEIGTYTLQPDGSLKPGQHIKAEKIVMPMAVSPDKRFLIAALMWHGGGLTGVTWETKPDGKPGWQTFFLNRGYDVYVSDAVERGRASWARYPEFFKSEPLFRSKKEAWELFRFGPTGSYDPNPANRRPFPDSQFPTEALDQFAKQGVPRWVTNDAATQAAYDQLVERVCPCVIVVHSQGGNFGFNAALRARDKIKALVAIEPSGAPDPGKVDVAQLKTVPHLFVFGDHLHDSPSWQNSTRIKSRSLWRSGLNNRGWISCYPTRTRLIIEPGRSDGAGAEVELVINLKTAKALGIEVRAPTLLARADEVIE